MRRRRQALPNAHSHRLTQFSHSGNLVLWAGISFTNGKRRKPQTARFFRSLCSCQAKASPSATLLILSLDRRGASSIPLKILAAEILR
jgi:hypothetical protein